MPRCPGGPILRRIDPAPVNRKKKIAYRWADSYESDILRTRLRRGGNPARCRCQATDLEGRDESGNQRRNHAGMVPADRGLIKVGGCVPRFVEKERRPPLRHQGIRSGGNLRVFENLAQTLVAVDAP